MVELAGLTNALTDIIAKVTDDDIKRLRLQKGYYNSQVGVTHQEFLTLLSQRESITIPGGSPMNVIHGATNLGVETALFGTVGDDKYGIEYVKFLEAAGIQSLINQIKGPSGICFVLVTPDGEKTSITSMGVAGDYNCDLSELASAKIFHTSGYELRTNPQKTLEALDYAKNIGAQISFDLADPDTVIGESVNLKELIPKIDMLFMTEAESTTLTGLSPEDGLLEISQFCPIAILKKGKRGSTVMHRRSKYEIPIYKVEVVNTLGAGDAYTAGFLSGYIQGYPVDDWGKIGSHYAGMVCSVEGPHL